MVGLFGGRSLAGPSRECASQRVRTNERTADWPAGWSVGRAVGGQKRKGKKVFPFPFYFFQNRSDDIFIVGT